MWLANTRISGDNYIAEFFENSAMFTKYHAGDEKEVLAELLLDWMVNDRGVLHGGFSLRYYRSTLPGGERE